LKINVLFHPPEIATSSEKRQEKNIQFFCRINKQNVLQAARLMEKKITKLKRVSLSNIQKGGREREEKYIKSEQI
jgi:hypothetical protein